MGDFGQAAVRLAGFAGVVLGWRPGEFWAATPAELGAVVAAMRGEGGEALSAEQLADLQEKFPDQVSPQGAVIARSVATWRSSPEPPGGHAAGSPRFARVDGERCHE